MTRPISALCVLVALALALAACGGGGDDSSTEATSSPKTEAAASSEIGAARVYRANTGEFQEILFDENGYTLYRFDKDKGSTPTCYGACAKQWPPLLTEGQPLAFAVIPKKLGTTKRNDGTTQATYFGYPLYTFVGDKKYPTGQVHGNGVEAFGGTWHAIRKNGENAEPR